MKFKIFVTRSIPEKGLQLLRKSGAQVSVFPKENAPSKQEISRGARGCDALLCLLTDRIDDEILQAAGPGLKIVANYAVGFNNIDVPAATARKVWVSNTPGVLTEASAEMAWALLMACARRLVESENYTRAKKFKGWGAQFFLGQGISGKTLGIVGAGRIGSAVAQMSKGFNMKVLYTARTRKTELEDSLQAQKVSLNELLKKSDFVSLHVPYSKETHHLIGAAQLRAMKKTAVLVNTSRGAVVDEKALVQALQKETIFSAGLDVYENEPRIEPGLFKLKNAVLAPHIASATLETREKMAVMAAQNILAALKNKRPPNAVNAL